MSSLFNYAIGPSSTVSTYYPQDVFETDFSCCKTGTTTQEDDIKPYIIFSVANSLSTLKKLVSTSNTQYEFDGGTYDIELDVYSDGEYYHIENNFKNVDHFMIKTVASTNLTITYSVSKYVSGRNMVLVPFNGTLFTLYDNVVISDKQYSSDLKTKRICCATNSYYVGMSDNTYVTLNMTGNVSNTSITTTSNSLFSNEMFKTISLQEQMK